MKIQEKTFFVTGAGSGIGRNLVLELLKRGAQVAAADIDAETLEETIQLAGEFADKISTYVVNVADREAVEDLPEKIIARHGTIDAIINNAGIIQPFVRINNLDYEVIEKVVDVNLWGPIYVTKAFLPYLLERPEAHIVNVSSMGGFFPFPGQTMYGASKAGVKLLTEGLYSELKDTNVKVSVVFPGAVDTNITKNSGLNDTFEAESEQAALKPLPASVAARIIVDGIEKDKYRILVGTDAKMMDLLYRISPRRAAELIAAQMKNLMAN